MGRVERSHAIANGVVFLVIFATFLAVSSLAAFAVQYLGYSSQYANFVLDAGLGLSMTASTLTYLFAYKKMSTKEVIGSLGLGRSGLSASGLGIALLIFSIVMLMSLGASALGGAFGVNINTNVSLVFSGAPLWFYVFAAVIEPINEELLFRGLMVPRLGIVVSALIFGILHAGYNSTFAIEVIAAMAFGLIAGYVFRRTGSLYPSMMAHILVNSIAVVALLAV